jgi:hypothetical protein
MLATQIIMKMAAAAAERCSLRHCAWERPKNRKATSTSIGRNRSPFEQVALLGRIVTASSKESKNTK